MASPLNFYFIRMNQGAKIVSESIIGSDFRTVFVAGKAYTVYPPTVHKLAGAISHLSWRTRSRQFERSPAFLGRKRSLQQGSLLADSW